MLEGKHIILGISGGIAAYKSAMLARLLIKRGAEVQVVATPNALEFITPVTLSALTGKPVVSRFFTANTGEWHSHVDLGLWADAMVVAPATACTIAKMAHGVADNMLITTYLSAKAPVFVAPAMDLDMMRHPSTVHNLELLQSYGNQIIEAAEGELASHLTGKGRMQEPEVIVERLEAYFAGRATVGSLAGKKVLITAGPTVERIDPVRYISNFSTGKMGYALAEEAAGRGAQVTLVSGPVSIEAKHPAIKVVKVESARQMDEAAKAAFGDADIAIMTAAVADFRPATASEVKIKREGRSDMSIDLVANPDIAAGLGAKKRSGQVLVGFALETDPRPEVARRKIADKGLDMLVVNSLADAGAGFATDTNKVTLQFANGRPDFPLPLKSKAEVAADIFDAIQELR